MNVSKALPLSLDDKYKELLCTSNPFLSSYFSNSSSSAVRTESSLELARKQKRTEIEQRKTHEQMEGTLSNREL